MERTKKTTKQVELLPVVEEEPKIRWVKNGGGIFRLKDGRKIKTKEVFFARLEDIPEAFRDNIVPADYAHLSKRTIKKKLKEHQKPLSVVELEYSVVEREKGIFDVVDAKGKALNEQPLSEDEANDLLNSLI